MSTDYIDKGILQVSVSTEKFVIPTDNALVRITDPLDGSVIEEVKTDSSGQTPAVELPAPPLEYSVNGGDERPYALYNVTVSAADTEVLHIDGVQILPTSSAIQNAVLRPAVPGGFNVRNTLINSHSLWTNYPAKIPENEVKPIDNASGFVVLPEPVIPEYIVVHLGNPDDISAGDVEVPFKEYIKNVASCEIYSTWKTETIKANILAILSFTLNRVYTEWYRGKGHDFTVTNSTAYDQAFNYGRNIFKEISVAVDELFTNYITRENIEQPLFTQYCDGKHTQCGGLSQWGSQALGEQGYDALSILKTYYGSDIYIESAEKVEGIPSSYPGEPLQIGSLGEAVRTVQTQLNKISNNYPLIAKLRIDGSYGESTANSVKTFQKIFYLPETGDVDFSTWYQISNIYVAISKMAS